MENYLCFPREILAADLRQLLLPNILGLGPQSPAGVPAGFSTDFAAVRSLFVEPKKICQEFNFPMKYEILWED